MDYSLVVGVDSVKNELVVGIVGTLGLIYKQEVNLFCLRLYSNVHMGQEA